MWRSTENILDKNVLIADWNKKSQDQNKGGREASKHLILKISLCNSEMHYFFQMY